MSRPPDDKTIGVAKPSEARPLEVEDTGKRSGKSADPWSGFEPYALLCRSLLPRARGVFIFDARGALRWSADSSAAADLSPLVAGALVTARTAPESAGDLHLLPGNVPAYVCWIRDEAQHVLAVLAITCAPGGEREPE